METKKLEYLPASYYRVGQKVQEKEGRLLVITQIEDAIPGLCKEQTISVRKIDGITSIQLYPNEIKPVLRRMESMTAEERSEYQRFIEDNYGEPFASTGYLYSLGIDIPTWVGDKLILSLTDAGLAVDAATLEL